MDDEISIINITQRVLNSLWYSVRTATDPVEALDIFENDHDGIDLVPYSAKYVKKTRKREVFFMRNLDCHQGTFPGFTSRLPGLVITDMTMPRMNGVQLSAKLKNFKPAIPIIICTGNSTLIEEEHVKEIGIAACAMKPVTKAEIARLIRDVLASN